MQPHKTEDNNDENDIAAVIIELANAATKDKEKMTATFIDLTHTIMTLQDKIEKVDKKGRSRKKIIVMKVIARLMTELGTTTTKIVHAITKRWTSK